MLERLRNAGVSAWAVSRPSLLAITISLTISFVIVVAVSEQPVVAFRTFLGGAFENVYSFGSMLSIATILILSGLAATVGFRAGAFNAGGEGQIYVGALMAVVVAQAAPLPPPLAITAALMAGMVAGAIWILVPALMRVYLGIAEIVTTLMASYIAPLLTIYLLMNGGLRNPNAGVPETVRLVPELRLPRILSPSSANWGLFIALALVVAYWIVLERTRLGMRMKLVGQQPSFAETMGIDNKRVLLVSFFASGALAGLAGAIVSVGMDHRFIQSFSPGYGFLGITVALIGRLSPLGVILAALLYGALVVGAGKMQTASDVPFALLFVLQGVLVFLMTGNLAAVGRRLFGGR
ncbi:MAG: ABC transporter permease [Rhizobiaceae bacterium]|nr:ABC transporter permease [Rhizobiaceae bacterium]